MYYPYSKRNITVALKEVCGDKYSPIVWESRQLKDVKGRTGTRAKGIYSFKTKDGKEYEMIVVGSYYLGHCHTKLFDPVVIISIEEKKEEKK